jgi:hypothetical protein
MRTLRDDLPSRVHFNGTQKQTGLKIFYVLQKETYVHNLLRLIHLDLM